MYNNYEIEIELERSLLGVLITEPNQYVHISDILRMDSFLEQYHRDIYAACANEASMNKDITFFEIQDHLKKANNPKLLKYCKDIAANYGAKTLDFKRIAHKINENTSKIKLRNDLEVFVEELKEDKSSPEQIIGNLISSYEESKYLSKLETISSANWFLELEKNSGKIIKRYPLGLRIIDKGISGGVKPGELITVAGKYKSGKTTLALQFASSLKEQGLKVKWLALEMGADELNARLLSRRMNISPIQLEKEIIPNYKKHEKSLVEHLTYFQKNPFLVSHIRAADTDTLLNAIHQSVHKEQIDVIVIDYLQLVCAGSKTQSRVDFLEDLSSKIMALVKDYNLIGIVITQLGRSGETYGTDGMNRACDVALKVTKTDEDCNLFSIEPQALRSGAGFNGKDAFKIVNGTHFAQMEDM